jgi:pimeloyl-ACP methyl ester carboxylesterase
MGQVLSHERVTVEGAKPSSWLYMLHGIFGAGRNWSSLAKRLTRERPDWGVVLVDLRQHGASQGFVPPHTLGAAANDLAVLADETGLQPAAILGHSFGGKVALAFAGTRPRGLKQLWVVDSTPAAREPDGSAWRMLEIIRRMPRVFASRDELIAALEREGFAKPVAQWMATNLERRNGELGWRFDPDSMEALIRDFFRTDLWHLVERPPADLTLNFVKATESRILTPEDVARIRDAGDAVAYHEIEGGHWLNTDNPGALVKLLSTGLP